MDELTKHRKMRLRALIDSSPFNGSQAQFATTVGLTEGRVSQLVAPDHSFGERAAKNIASELRLDARYFEHGFEAAHPPAIPLSGYKTQPETGDIVIPQYDTGGAMGGGRLLLAEQPGLIKSWHVDHEWVRLNVKHYTSLSNLCIVTGFGNSMKPMFNPGDPLLIDKGVNHVDHDGIFFFRVGEHGFIKQIQRIPDPMTGAMLFRAKSMNDAQYDPFDIHPSNPQFAVLGKVLTVWKSEQY